jgi:hypothetical protein
MGGDPGPVSDLAAFRRKTARASEIPPWSGLQLPVPKNKLSELSQRQVGEMRDQYHL